MDSTNSKIAVLMLACRDYEAMELALACHTAYAQPDVPIFILQNCRGNYDAERTLEVARRYASLFPKSIHVIDHLPPGTPYHNILSVLKSDLFAPFDLICKVDDDAFPITPGWLGNLESCWLSSIQKYGSNLGYVTPLINNNNWGFVETIKALGLDDEYFSTISRVHRVGSGDSLNPYRILGPGEIATGANGTIWAYPYIARWLHAHSTLQPDRFIAATRGLPDALVPSKERYSIGCMLFRKELWSAVDDGGVDDEHMFHQHCSRNNLKIVANMSVPFVHLAFFSQREENRDIVETARVLFEARLGLPFPLSLRQSRLLEIEARLRWLESRNIAGTQPSQPAEVKTSATAPSLGKRIERSVRTRLYKLGLKKKRV